IALERGDCRTAAETYAAAAQKGDLAVARRSSEVSLACEHLPAAWDSVKRWRALAPTDRDAATIYTLVALELDDSKLAELSQLFLQEADASSTFAAMNGAIDADDASPSTVSLLAELAL